MAAQSVVPAQVQGLARLVDAFHHARPGDALAVLGGLPDPELAAGVSAAVLNLPVVVTDFVVAERSVAVAASAAPAG